MKITIHNFSNENDKRQFVASIHAALNEFFGEDKRIVLQIDPETKLKIVSESLRSIAEIIDCAKEIVKGIEKNDDDEEDPADFWKRGSN